jgi:pyruvate/2-oxoglutarate/acetoin dehydrogenase E1 component
MNYVESITAAMTWLGEQRDTIFIGQTVTAGGAGISKTLSGVPMEKRVEFPVAEEMQMGASLGMSLAGLCVMSIYSRIDFLLLALNQMVNHVDKIHEMSDWKMQPRMIIRTSIGPKIPLDGGVQHTNDYGYEIRGMCRNIIVHKLASSISAETIMLMYQAAYKNHYNAPATLFIEDGSGY